MPELGAFEVLLTVAQTGSLNAAARELGVTQQAISARVGSLEARTGIALLTRTTQGSSLTPAGIVVAEWADQLIRVAVDVDAGLAALRHDRRSRVRVGASLTVAEQLLPGWLVSFQAAAAAHEHRARPGRTDRREQRSRHRGRPRRARSTSASSKGPARAAGHSLARHRPRRAVPGRRRRSTRGRGGPGRSAPPSCCAPAWSRASRDRAPAIRSPRPCARRSATSARPAPPVLELSTAAAIRAAVLAGAGPAVMSRLAVADDLATHRLREVQGRRRRPATGAARDLARARASRRPARCATCSRTSRRAGPHASRLVAQGRPGRTDSTGQGAVRMMRCALLPSSTMPNGELRRSPTTISSTCSLSARARISPATSVAPTICLIDVLDAALGQPRAHGVEILLVGERDVGEVRAERDVDHDDRRRAQGGLLGRLLHRRGALGCGHVTDQNAHA